MDRDSRLIFRELVDAWQHVKTAIERLNGSAAVVPNDLTVVLRATENSNETLVRFEILPVVFKLPEKGGGSSTNLFAVVRGRVAFSRPEFRESGRLSIREFATEVGYFRHNGKTLDHVYGAHYDLSPDEVGHPAFHAQMKSFEEFSQNVTEGYGIQVPVKDVVKGILKTIRIPSAQLDVFSVFLQLCADHLLHSKSTPEEKAAFNTLLEKSSFCEGAASQIPRLTTKAAAQCYRSRHWYPSVA